jgi:hypothetical protein
MHFRFELATITEGGKKALSLLSKGIVSIAVYGVNAGYQITDPLTKLPLVSPRLIPDLLRFLGKGRRVFVAFDQDNASKTIKKVTAALGKFGRLLAATGSQVSVALWEPEQGKGIDDAIVQAGENAVEFLETIFATAPTFEEWTKDYKKIRFIDYLKRTSTNQIPPERFTEGGYLPELPELSPKAILVLEASTGAGKTTEIKRILASKGSRYTVIFCPTVSVGKKLAKELGIPHLSECDKSNPTKVREFWARVHDKRAIVLCPDSVDALTDCHTLIDNLDLVVFDEVHQSLRNLATGGTTKGEQGRVLESLAALLKKVIDRGGSLLVAEANIPQSSIELLKTLSGSDAVRLFRHKRTEGFSPRTTLYQGSYSGFLPLMAAAAAAGKKLFIPCSSQKTAEKTHRYLDSYFKAIGKPKKIVRVDSKTNDLKAFDPLFGNANNYLKDSGIDILIATPSIPSGVSFDSEFDYFDQVWGVFTSQTPEDWDQQQARVRKDVPRHLFIKPFIQSSGFERYCSERGVGQAFESNQKGFAKVFGVETEFLIESHDSARRLEIAAATNQFLQVHYASIGIQKAIAKDWFIELLQEAGHQVSLEGLDSDRAIQKALDQIKEDLEREAAEIIGDLEQAEDSPFNDGIPKARLRSPELRERYYRPITGGNSPETFCPTWIRNLLPLKLKAIETAPGIDYDDAEICYRHLTHEGGLQQRGTLLQALSENPDSAKSLERGEVEAVLRGRLVLPHKLPRNFWKAQLIHLSGVSALLDGETYSNSDPRAIAIKKAALHWAKEIWKWLGLTINDDQTPIEICNKLLHKLGLTPQAIARPGTNGKRDRVYKIPGLCDPYRNDLLEAMRRRLREFDPASVEDSVDMLRSAGEDTETLRLVWNSLQDLPDGDRGEIWRRLSEWERTRISGVGEGIAA